MLLTLQENISILKLERKKRTLFLLLAKTGRYRNDMFLGFFLSSKLYFLFVLKFEELEIFLGNFPTLGSISDQCCGLWRRSILTRLQVVKMTAPAPATALGLVVHNFFY